MCYPTSSSPSERHRVVAGGRDAWSICVRRLLRMQKWLNLTVGSRARPSTGNCRFICVDSALRYRLGEPASCSFSLLPLSHPPTFSGVISRTVVCLPLPAKASPAQVARAQTGDTSGPPLECVPTEWSIATRSVRSYAYPRSERQWTNLCETTCFEPNRVVRIDVGNLQFTLVAESCSRLSQWSYAAVFVKWGFRARR